MASSSNGCPHMIHPHHHHHHHCTHCPLRRHCRHCPLHNPPFSQSFPFYPSLLQNQQQQQRLPTLQNPNITSHPQVSQEPDHIELDDEEEEDEPVFVLTDEWREFFAKSEARRKLEKKQAKKGKNK